MKKNLQLFWLKPEGLHLRPASLIARALEPLKSRIAFQCRGCSVDAKSPLELLTLAVEAGERINIDLNGEDAPKASRILKAVLQNWVSWG